MDMNDNDNDDDDDDDDDNNNNNYNYNHHHHHDNNHSVWPIRSSHFQEATSISPIEKPVNVMLGQNTTTTTTITTTTATTATTATATRYAPPVEPAMAGNSVDQLSCTRSIRLKLEELIRLEEQSMSAPQAVKRFNLSQAEQVSFDNDYEEAKMIAHYDHHDQYDDHSHKNGMNGNSHADTNATNDDNDYNLFDCCTNNRSPSVSQQQQQQQQQQQRPHNGQLSNRRLFGSIHDYVKSKHQIRYHRHRQHQQNNLHNRQESEPSSSPLLLSKMLKYAFNYDSDNHNQPRRHPHDHDRNHREIEKKATCHRARISSSLNNLFHSPSILLAMIFSFLLTTSLVCLLTLHTYHEHEHQSQNPHQNQHQQHQQQLARMQADSLVVKQELTMKTRNEHSQANRRSSSSSMERRGDSLKFDNLSRFDEARTVQTECGKFIGLIEHEAIVFRGLPYALAPIGVRRWSRPVAIWRAEPPGGEKWQSKSRPPPLNSTNTNNNGHAKQADEAHNWPGSVCQADKLYRAYQHAPICHQLSPLSHNFIGQEDCLYLDIWTPRLDAMRRPVMVYIHGGFLSFGSSGQGQANLFEMGPSASLALAMECVLVSFNYRLQALGFLALEQLANDGPNSSMGNYGLWDQLTALKWIKRNIANFGGDPNNIILFGPDSASALPLALLSNEMSHRDGPNGQVTAASPPDDTLDIDASNESQLIEDDRQLYHAVWLTNPSLYFDVPFFVAAKHNQHTFLHKLPCHSQHNLSPSASIFASASASSTPTPIPALTSSTSIPPTAPIITKANETSNQNQKMDLECLYSMSSEQIIRHFLGQDEPSYRLDDQNDLPIHGIFADQFVVVDGELITNPFPFVQSTNTGSSGSVVQKTYKAQQQSNGPSIATTNSKRATKRVLIGSSQQAVEYWPCPRDIDQWSWENFTRYVITSLNSFSASAVEAASSMYGDKLLLSPKESLQNHSNANIHNKQPMEDYLTLVSDIRQICPINELARQLTKSDTTQVHRYIVDHRPDKPITMPPRSIGTQLNQYEPRLAFHMWDLMAFFGLDNNHWHMNGVGQNELKFQKQIREMVKSFIQLPHSASSNEPYRQTTKDTTRDPLLQYWISHWPGINSTHSTNKIGLFDREANFKLLDTYKYNECKMWRKHLARDYAWVS